MSRRHIARATRRLVAPAAGVTALAIGAAGLTTPVAAAAEPTDLTVICDGIGEDVVTITGDLAKGGSAQIGSGPLRVVGTPGFTGTGEGGRTVSVAPTGTGPVCTARGTTTKDDLDEILPTAQAAKGLVSGPVTGHLTFTVEVDSQSVAAAQQRGRAKDATGATEAAGARFPFERSLKNYLDGRPGAVGVAVRVPGTSRVYTYTKTSSRNVTASIVKVHVMAAVMLRAQDNNRGLTSWEKSKIVPMIRNSDNAATTDLFNNLGGAPALQRAANRLGMTATYPNVRWGLTSTVPSDQTKLMEHFARPTGLLSSTNRSYGLTQMRSIASDQDWGVTAGPPSGTVALKNGWLPRTDGWHVNSIGFSSTKTGYTIGVLTHHNPGAMGTQISTIEGVSRIVYRYRDQLAPSTPPPPPPARGVRGDVDGNATPDLLAASKTGRIYVYKGNGRGGVGAKTLLHNGASDATWFGNAGDLNRDKRADLLVRRGDGRLQLLMSKSGGGYAALKTIATSWSKYTSIATGTDVDGNGRLDLVGRRMGGYADHFQINDAGVVSKVRTMGSPFRWYPTIVSAGDFGTDGKADLRGVATGGRMRAWTSTGTSWSQRSATSVGFDRYAVVASPGDLNRTSSKQSDVVAMTPGGTLHAYWGKTDGGVSGPVRLSPSAYGMTSLF